MAPGLCCALNIPRWGNANNDGTHLVVPLRFPNHGHPAPLLQRVAGNLQHTLFTAVEALQLAETRFKNEAFEVSEMIEHQAVDLSCHLVVFVMFMMFVAMLVTGG